MPAAATAAAGIRKRGAATARTDHEQIAEEELIIAAVAKKLAGPSNTRRKSLTRFNE
jgi:hypothetical protein